MAVFIAGTGTNVGKTLFSALVMARYGKELNLKYLKPVQTGPDSDRETVMNLSGLETGFFLPEEYSFALAASPHYAAESEGRSLDITKLKSRLKGYSAEKVIVELAGGLMVPLTRGEYYTNLDLIRDVGFSTVLLASTELGTINHTVLSYNALKATGVSTAGIFFMGNVETRYSASLPADNMRTIIEMTGAANLGVFLIPEKKISSPEFQTLALEFDSQEKVRAILA